MNPRKAKDLLPELSISSGLPLELLQDLTDFYWEANRKALTSLDELYILIPHLGTFAIKGDIVLTRDIDKLSEITRAYERNPPKTTVSFARLERTKARLDKLIKLRERVFENDSKKKSNKQLRSEIRTAKEALEGQGQNS